MTTRLIKAVLPIGFMILCGLSTQVFAGRIDLENVSTTTASQAGNPFIFHLQHFSRFSLEGPTVQTSFSSAQPPQFRVSVFSLADYGITNANLAQLGSLLQVEFNVSFASVPQFGQAEISLFLIDPITLEELVVGSRNIFTPNSAIFVFSVSEFGTLPSNLTPDFFIGVRGSVGLQSVASNASQSTLTIASNVPEPASLILLLSGLSAAGVLVKRQRR